MTDHREASFQEHLKRQENYFNAVVKAGDLPWFSVGNAKRDERIAQLSLPADVSDEDLRRAVFMRKYGK